MAITSPKSWTFTGKVVDFADDRRRCDCCERPGMRFGCQVQTKGKGAADQKYTAYVGMDCLFDNGFQLPEDWANTDLQLRRSELLREATHRALVRELIALEKTLKALDWAKEISLARLISSVQKHKLLSPKQALFLLSMVERSGHDFPLSLIRITTRTNRWRDQLAELSSEDAGRLDPYLTTSQKRWITQNAAD